MLTELPAELITGGGVRHLPCLFSLRRQFNENFAYTEYIIFHRLRLITSFSHAMAPKSSKDQSTSAQQGIFRGIFTSSTSTQHSTGTAAATAPTSSNPPARTNTSPPASQPASQSLHDDITQNSRKAMDQVVEQYRQGKITRKAAETALEDQVHAAGQRLSVPTTREGVRRSIQGWVLMLDDHDKEVKRGRATGDAIAGELQKHSGGVSDPPRDQNSTEKGKERHQSPDRNADPSSPSSSDSSDDNRHRGRKRSRSPSRSPPRKHNDRKRRRRKRSPSPSDDSSDSSTSSSSDSSSHHSSRKKPKLNKKLFPFVQRNRHHLKELRRKHGSREVIRRQLENYSRDPKEAARRVLYSRNAPPLNFEEWKTVLPGEYTSLDNLYYRLHPSSSSDTIQTQSEWSEAWSYFRRAICHAFSGRDMELQAYEDYILRSFRTRQTSFHPNIISFDRDNRRNVLAANKEVLFSDFEFFSQNRESWLESSGINNTQPSRKSASSTVSRRGGEICRNWNSKKCSGDKTCPNRRRHVCLNCESPDHVRDSCPGGSSSSSTLPKSERH
ncbi:hypothetical protein VNI00_017832 [Paramarasmius palmivorus]|uniref:CCHC-type domain-containing protein n=1 Tax=Paramarasmius palmivorus TaxID=297713 RepID=A0AAW0B4P9_9AGAR